MPIKLGLNNVSFPDSKIYLGEDEVYAESKYEQLVNYLMLYDYGDECVDVTGGWELTKVAGRGTPTYTENNNNIYLYTKAISGNYGLFAAAGNSNPVDVTDYVQACVYWQYYRDHISYNMNRFACGSKKDGYYEFVGTDGCLAVTNNEDHLPLSDTAITSIDISNISQAVYIQESCQSNSTTRAAYSYMYHCFLVKADDWATLASKANITASSISDILTNSSVLLSNKDAVEFMIAQCTGNFMVSAITNSTFLTALNNSTYKTAVFANEHWNKFLTMVA